MNAVINKPVQATAVSLLIIGVAVLGLSNAPRSSNISSIEVENRTEIVQQKAGKFERARPITNPSGFVNTENVSIRDNIGEKVILLDMWTYSCINCQRTLPHLREWDRKYRDDGLLIIGNHAPEFEFEKKRSNVKKAAERFNLTYPIVLDNNYGTWQAYNNRYWPQKYLIGVDGFIRYEHIGEGRYDETEQKIRELLKELKKRKGLEPVLDNDSVREVETGDIGARRIGTPELYFGAFRNQPLANGLSRTIGTQDLERPDNVKKNRLYLAGKWSIQREYAESHGKGKIILKYQARDVNMVASGPGQNISVAQDGQKAREVKVEDEMLYPIIRNNGYGTHTLEITVPRGFKAYTFTFG